MNVFLISLFRLQCNNNFVYITLYVVRNTIISFLQLLLCYGLCVFGTAVLFNIICQRFLLIPADS